MTSESFAFSSRSLMLSEWSRVDSDFVQNNLNHLQDLLHWHHHQRAKLQHQ
ncbi:unnamed protein product [Coffea canephora]|uniref:Uncharacterized protein n=1 Tax=Coffea canephora TaxID=49390 RepID=A0A068V2U8_COFCA|nr:unnamed protein product [Coffea canephora]